MAQTTPPLPPPPSQATAQKSPTRRRKNLFLPTFTLAGWRLRQTWRLLLLTGLGTIAAVMLVCAVPLYSEIALSAGLRSALAQDPNADQLTVQLNNALTQDQLLQVERQLDQTVHQDMGSYVNQPAVFSVSLDGLGLAAAGQSTPSGNEQTLRVVGINDGEMTKHINLVSGRLPQADAKHIEVALTQNDAATLQATVGSTLNIFPPQFGPSSSNSPTTIPVLVVGIYAQQRANDPIFSTNIFFGGQFSGPEAKPASAVQLVASNQTLLTALAEFETNFSKGQDSGPTVAYPGSPPFNWYYHLDLSRITVDNMDDLAQRLQNVQSDLFNNGANGPGGIANVNANLRGDLIGFKVEIIIAQVPIVFLLLQVVGLILLFISLMVNLLVERQADAIAVLRSRGAPRGLVFRSMTVQTICVCLLALVAGPVLAFLLVNVLATNALGSQQYGAVSVILGQPAQTAWGLRWYALIAVLGAFVAMLISTYRAANLNILALRRDNARSGRKPFWQRLNLDIVFAVIAFVGYALYTYAVGRVPGTVRLLLSPLALVAPIFILLAASLLFLRFFPALLNLGAKIAVRSRNAAPMLAISQMARSPRQASRMTLLLALSTAFALFTLIFSASQYQRTLDVSAFAVGSDFSGQLSTSSTGGASLSDLRIRYQQIPGVTSAMLAYTGDYGQDSNPNQVDISYIAADMSTYGQTVIWQEQSGPSSVSLASQLVNQRSQAIANSLIPVVVDQAFAQDMHVNSAGSRFTLIVSSTQLNFVVLAVVENIPTLYNNSDSQLGNNTGGLLMDYQTLNAIYLHGGISAPALPAPNTVWLRTSDDSGSLATVRSALTNGPLAVTRMQDRRALINKTQSNPLLIDLFGTLYIGAGTALVLALLGILVASWLSARSRVTNFALLRAMGTEPTQLTGVLLWEQGIIYGLSLVLGLLIGVLLSILVLPVLVFANGILNLNVDTNTLDIPPIHAVYPLPLIALALGILLVICLFAIFLMTSIISRASISQALRLNED